MFDHSNTIEPRRLNKLAERLSHVSELVAITKHGLSAIADSLTRDERSALSLLCTLYRLSPQMPVEDKITLWVHGPDGGKAATLTGDDLDRMVSQVTERLESKIEDLERQVAATRTALLDQARPPLRSKSLKRLAETSTATVQSSTTTT